MIKHQAYKSSGAKWIGDIPSHWATHRIGNMFFERKEKVDDVTFPPLSVTKSGIVDQLKDVAKSDDNKNRKRVNRLDFVINSRSDRKGSSGIAGRDGSVSLINIVLGYSELDTGYVGYLLKSYNFVEEFFRNGRGIHWDLWTTRWEQLKDIKIAVPTLHEQTTVSKFLNTRTTRIDSIVQATQKKIDLLKEQRKVLINNCVTKGLDSTFEMKDSGVEWIGDIPKHWKAVKLKYLVTYNDDTLSNDTDPDYQFHYIQIGDVSYLEKLTGGEFIKFEESPASARRVVKHNDVIVSTVRINLRSIAIVPKVKNVICSTAFCVLRGKWGKVNQKFLQYSVGSEWFIAEAVASSTGVAYPTISSSDLVEQIIIVPPASEQKEIVEYLDEQIDKINKLISLESRRIELLKEYRQSLISSAVTGKIRITEEMI